MAIGVKIWLTLAVLFPVALGVVWTDEGDTILTVIGIIEMLSFFAFSVGMVIIFIWST